MADKRITDVDFLDSLSSDESFFVNQNNTIKQINKGNINFDIANGGTGATTAAGALSNLGGLPNTGGVMSGNLSFVKASPEIRFYDENTNRMFLLSSFESGDTYETRFYAYAPTGYYQSYYLPLSPSDLAANSRYALLTTRDAVTIAQGGTGATTAAAALNNLGAAAVDHSHSVADLPTVPIIKGGTGSTDGATGLKNLFAAGNTILSSYQYGDSLPDAGNVGRIFFKKA